MVILENIDIDKAILQNIDIDKISNRFKFGISNRANDLKSCEPVYTDVPNNHICRSADPSCLHQNHLRLQSIALKEICAKLKKIL